MRLSAAGKLLADYSGQLPTRLWVAPPTRMDETQLISEGYYSTYGKVGARTEMPGCSLCMGNQARVADKSTVVSTSTRNFPNRLGKGANVFLASAELAAVAAIEGKLPTGHISSGYNNLLKGFTDSIVFISVAEYLKYSNKIQATAKDTFRCNCQSILPQYRERLFSCTDLNFHELPNYVEASSKADMGAEYQTALDREVQRLKQN